jgi:hypothetical protein
MVLLVVIPQNNKRKQTQHIVYLISGFHCQIILYANCRLISRNTKVELLTTSRYFYFPILPCNEDFLELSFAYKYVYSKKEI